jgi:iojap-like ribosome-associated protein
MNSLELAKKAARLLDDKKALNINVVKIENISSLTDYFVIATGTVNTHVRALSEEVEVKLKEADIMPAGVEGHRSNSWVLLDYISVVVHVFTEEARGFYDLDRLWRDGEKIDFLS